MLSNGFELNKEKTCSDGPCKYYEYKDILMYATYYEDGTLILQRILFSAEDNQEQGVVQKEILYSLYPKDMADTVMGGQASNQDGKTELPYSGKINGYEYGAYLKSLGMNDPLSGNDILVMVIFVKPID